jgi:hypothetical protein
MMAFSGAPFSSRLTDTQFDDCVFTPYTDEPPKKDTGDLPIWPIVTKSELL